MKKVYKKPLAVSYSVATKYTIAAGSNVTYSNQLADPDLEALGKERGLDLFF